MQAMTTNFCYYFFLFYRQASLNVSFDITIKKVAMFGEYRKDGNLIKTQILQDFATVSLVLILYSIQISVCILVKYGILSTTRLG